MPGRLKQTPIRVILMLAELNKLFQIIGGKSLPEECLSNLEFPLRVSEQQSYHS